MNDLHDWITFLEEHQQLIRVREPISSDLEITEFTDRICKGPEARNKALLFENVAGSGLPVLINQFGSAQRMAWALGVDALDDLNRQLSHLIDLRLPKGLQETLGRSSELLKALFSTGIKPKKVHKAPVQEIVQTNEASLDALPILKCWPKDGGRFITLPQVITCDPETGIRNVGMYRLQVIDEKTLLVHWQRHKGGATHERNALQIKVDKLPAAIVLGGDPACEWCASAPLPENIDEYMLAGYLRKAPVEFVEAVSQPIEVPAQAEIVIEGFIDLTDHRTEGPFGDHTGYYTPVEPFPVFHVTAITRRKDAVYPATVVGIPPMEDAWMGKATERLFLPLIRLFLPEVKDICMPVEGGFHNIVIVSFKKQYPGHGRKVMHAIWGLGLMMLTKAIIVVDEWVDVQNLSQVTWQVAGNVDWKCDIELTEGPVDHLDHSASHHSYGGKIGIDATAKWTEEGITRPWPEVITMTPEVKHHVDELWEKIFG